MNQSISFEAKTKAWKINHLGTWCLLLLFMACLFYATNNWHYQTYTNLSSNNSVKINAVSKNQGSNNTSPSKYQGVDLNTDSSFTDYDSKKSNTSQTKTIATANVSGNSKNYAAIFSEVQYASTNIEFPALSSGMTNVTNNESGYHLKFTSNNPGKIAIQFDPSKIPVGYTANDVFTYRYNTENNNWEQVQRDGIDFGSNEIHSTASKDGDFINAIIKVPEAPEAQGYVPTTMSDIKVGDPASMVQVIQPPSANNQGTAKIKYHIEIPQGRLGLEPNLNVEYNSDGNNGILGEGWSLSGISSITVDTRWGVPRYDASIETETYLLDGQMLCYKENNVGQTAHRYTNINRSNRDTTVFMLRKESSFDKILRIGTLPENYYWVKIDQSGTKCTYGKDSGSSRISKLIDLTPAGRSEWKLERMEDRFGNYISFEYKKIASPNTIILPKLIKYTKHDNADILSYHIIEMNYQKTPFADSVLVNSREGIVKNGQAFKIQEIAISRVYEDYNPQLVRKYKFDYKPGAFNKTLFYTQQGIK